MTNKDKTDVLSKCKIIYPPSGQAGEYAELATNPYRGCGHGCTYCYVPGVIRMSRSDFDNNVTPRKAFMQRLLNDARKYQAAGVTTQVMLSFTTDPYNHVDVEVGLTAETLQVLKDHSMGICTLTKGGRRALRDIELFRPGRDSFATTLTTLDAETSLTWEPNAALPDERIEVLETFHSRGISTWVSLEPVYDTESTLEIIRQTHKFVDLYKIGRINYHRLTKVTNWAAFGLDVIELCERLGAGYYLKQDLRQALKDADPLDLIYAHEVRGVPAHALNMATGQNTVLE